MADQFYKILSRNKTIFFFGLALGTLLLCLSQLHSTLIIDKDPTIVIEGPEANLNQPEAIAFSPSGDCLAVANAGNASITIYERIGRSGAQYETAPSDTIQNTDLLSYVHGVNFSPCGTYLAAASRNDHTIVFFEREKSERVSFNKKPYWVMQGASTAKINMPSGLSISPCGKMLAVANRNCNNSIIFYNLLKGKISQYHRVPFQIITAEALLEYDAAGVHDIAFSPDGKTVGILSKRLRRNLPGQTALTIYEKKEIHGGKYHFVPSSSSLFGEARLHTIAFHPSGKYLSMSDSEEEVLIFEKADNSNEYTLTTSIPIDKKGKLEGAKGVDFSSCGNYIAITTLAPMILIYEIHEMDN